MKKQRNEQLRCEDGVEAPADGCSRRGFLPLDLRNFFNCIWLPLNHKLIGGIWQAEKDCFFFLPLK